MWYVWGTFGQLLTDALFNQKLKQYPKEVGRYADFIKKNWKNHMVTDCVGFVKSYLFFDGQKVKYDPKFDVNANVMLERCKEKGTINTIPEIKGLLVWKQGHIGVYIGGGYVIEANSTMKGVIKTPLRGQGATKWTHWGKCLYIEYVTEQNEKPQPVDEFEVALKKIESAGVTKTPSYWRENAVDGNIIKGEHARDLIINMAKVL